MDEKENLINENLSFENIDVVFGYLMCMNHVIEYFRNEIQNSKEINFGDFLIKAAHTTDYVTKIMVLNFKDPLTGIVS